jgi:hypothetical protein
MQWQSDALTTRLDLIRSWMKIALFFIFYNVGIKSDTRFYRTTVHAIPEIQVFSSKLHFSHCNDVTRRPRTSLLLFSWQKWSIRVDPVAPFPCVALSDQVVGVAAISAAVAVAAVAFAVVIFAVATVAAVHAIAAVDVAITAVAASVAAALSVAADIFIAVAVVF